MPPSGSPVKEQILDNLGALAASGVPFLVRIPLVPGVTDTPANLNALAGLVPGVDGLVGVELLPYNRAAGAKYAACGRPFEPSWDETRIPRADTTAFAGLGVPVTVA